MNENLTEAIEQYLKIETSYAVIIRGSYGIGKTHFYKNILSPKIREVNIPNSKDKKYTPIYISLFGIKKIEDIQIQIFLATYPILKNKKIRWAGGIGKSIIRGLAQIGGLGDIDKYIDDINITADDINKYDELVICFDDIDRKSNSLEIKDFLGFINNMVENDGSKMIIIANTEVLSKDDGYLSETWEKVIGVSVEYKSDLKTVYNSIIEERYSSDKDYHIFLKENYEKISGIIKKNENNLRNLIYFLEHFKIIFKFLFQEFSKDGDYDISQKEKLQSVLDFSLPVAVEYKMGRLNPSDFENMKGLANLMNFITLSDLDNPDTKNHSDEEEKNTSYAEKFNEKYFATKPYHYFDSVFLYLTGQAAFDVDKLKNELNKLYIIEDGRIPNSQIVLNKLGYFDCLELTNRDYRNLTFKMLKYVDQGAYSLKQYPTTFHFAIRFNNILNLDITKLIDRLKKGIEKGKDNYQYDMLLSHQFVIDDNNIYKSELSEIIKYCLDINNKIKHKKEQKESNDLQKLFKEDFPQFLDKVKEPSGRYRTYPFWISFPINSISQKINKLGNKDIIELAFYFHDRYRPQIYEGLHSEKTFLINLKERINAPKKRKIKNLRNASLDILIKHIDESITHFK